MREWLVVVSGNVIDVIDWIALLLIVIGTAQALVGVIRLATSGGDALQRRDVWLGYARWLVGALTFQLAADIIETSITEDWEAIVRITAIAVVRTFLNYFLERDLAEMRERGDQPSAFKESR